MEHRNNNSSMYTTQYQSSRPRPRRPPLGDATKRLVNTQVQHDKQLKVSVLANENLPHEKALQDLEPTKLSPYSIQRGKVSGRSSRAESPHIIVSNPRRPIIGETLDEYKRNSQVSTASTNASDGNRVKSHIGPWRLGKTLGKGATARVRLARHAFTGQEAAIKIVQKKNAQLSQAGSLAALDEAESRISDPANDVRRMPVGIEREVAIMKLIQHPNIMKLYDIWENRTEIYLVLEYVENGELFEHITKKGRLAEEEAIKYFRQILSAVGYCHSFNICHRDLKPENILLSRRGDIKIADFGMAALHQSPDHKLKTSCGSPHYAAPELIRGANYRGELVDIWSMGVILYATLAGRLPFDVDGTNKEWLGTLLAKIRVGSYEMAPEFSSDAANLIWRILQVDPRDRINLHQIWQHPLLRKYDYLDSFGGGFDANLTAPQSQGQIILRRGEIDKQLLRHLRSLWHRLDESELVEALLSREPNDQRLFYGLLLKYRDIQLENYTPDIGYSSSDYHHVRPTLTKTYSTSHFPPPNARSHTRQGSRFTVISNAADTEQSYDPFKASRPQHLDSVRPSDGARVIIHRKQGIAQSNGHISSSNSRTPSAQVSSLTSSRDFDGHARFAGPRGFTTRSSLASSTMSRRSIPHVKPSIGHKRGVSFTATRNRSRGTYKRSSLGDGTRGPSYNSEYRVATNDESSALLSIAETPKNYIRSRKPQAIPPQRPQFAKRANRSSQYWQEDVRQLSNSLAKDCDEAFNRPTGSPSMARRKPRMNSSLETRPLPPAPVRSESVDIELLEARKQAELRKKAGTGESTSYLNRMVSHIDRLIQPSSPNKVHNVGNRASSAPLERKPVASGRKLAPINEMTCEDVPRKADNLNTFLEYHHRRDANQSRTASAPEARVSTPEVFSINKAYQVPISSFKDTIRVVDTAPPGNSPIPAPLSFRKKPQGEVLEPREKLSNDGREGGHTLYKSSRREHLGRGSFDAESGQAWNDEEETNYDNSTNGSNASTAHKKKSSWFKRNSRGSDYEYIHPMTDGVEKSQRILPDDGNRTDTAANTEFAPKKRGFNFGRLFKKKSANADMTVTPDEIFEDETGTQSMAYAGEMSRTFQDRHSMSHDDPRSRQIEPQRNWLAKLFHVKPVARYICFSIPTRRARQEIANLLKDWKRYGIREIQVDRMRNVVFGKVGKKNYLDMKEVSFAAEVMTIIEHGRRSHLSIARFTQERGAASSFNKVVDTVETVLGSRGLLVADERKKRMMVKTLNASQLS